ncbi:Protein of unknown function [Gryllus bimaculatus]|nr:Protein of unknown function [Gryllus bimaculatus]
MDFHGTGAPLAVPAPPPALPLHHPHHHVAPAHHLSQHQLHQLQTLVAADESQHHGPQARWSQQRRRGQGSGSRRQEGGRRAVVQRRGAGRLLGAQPLGQDASLRC